MADVLFDDLFNPAPDPDADKIFAKVIARPVPSGDALKERGQVIALDAAADEYKAAFVNAVLALAQTGIPFTADDVTARVGLMRASVVANRNNVVGALMTACAKKGWIRKTGRMVKSRRMLSHASEIREWVGCDGV